MAYRTLTHDAFIAEYRPKRNADGSYYRQRDFSNAADMRAVDAARAEHRVWTMLDVDGEAVLSAGCHVVNRLYYVICAVPFDPTDAWDVMDD